ncbi:SH3 domain-containing protein [Streptacidiphilus sp. MAP5-52]|uniref:SH3 domain-containing protein n=1 Tax=Streptacidiphilus sp. MAP5-52 TaxID=3156267 RepID=UPI003514481F
MRKAINLTIAIAALGAALIMPSASASAATPSRTTVAHTAYVDCDEYWATTVVKVRTGPSTGYTAIGQLGKHNTVDWVGENSSGSWTKVRLLQKSTYGLPKSTVGWVSSAYLAYISPCYTSIDV